MNWNLRYAKDKEEKSSGKFKPPAGVISAAKHALKLIAAGKAGDGFTSVGRHRAHQLAAGEMVPLSDIKRMHSYFSRHGVDKKGKDWNNDSPGKVAWLAWGGDAGKAWAASIVKKHGGGDSKKKESSYRYAEADMCVQDHCNRPAWGEENHEWGDIYCKPHAQKSDWAMNQPQGEESHAEYCRNPDEHCPTCARAGYCECGECGRGGVRFMIDDPQAMERLRQEEKRYND
jgi:hypothetical protein